jgi:cell division protein FtsL
MSAQAATRAAQRPVRPPQPRPRLRLARPRRPASRLAFAVLTALVVVAGVLALAALTVAVNQQAFTVARLEQATRQSATRYSVLQAEVDALRSPARVSRVAHERGLHPISRARIVRWPSSAPRSGGNASLAPSAATSPAAAGATSPAAIGDTGDPVKSAGQLWTQDDPFPLKHYLAQP